MIKGIDVASYQPEKYPVAGLDFVFIKATQGTGYVNPRLAGQTATARSAKLVTGFYHFLRSGQIKEQAAYFLAHAPERAGDMLVCDWETPPTGQGSPATNAEKGQFLAELKRLRPGARVLLYCNRDYWLNRDQGSVCGDGLWIADPTTAGHPRIKHAWTFHQYAVQSGTDRNVGNFADRAALAKWAGVPSTPAPAPAPTLEQRVSSLEKRVTALEKRG